MKLNKDIKDRIDNYFDNISSEDLYLLAKTKYGFKELDFEFENQGFSTIGKKFYCPKIDNSIDASNNEEIALAA